jgi:hypothetical protein
VVSERAVTRLDLAKQGVDEAFWEIVCADEDLLRSEFEAIVAAGEPDRTRPEPPPLVPHPGPGPACWAAQQARDPGPARGGQRTPVARQRGPPKRFDRPETVERR